MASLRARRWSRSLAFLLAPCAAAVASCGAEPVQTKPATVPPDGGGEGTPDANVQDASDAASADACPTAGDSQQCYDGDVKRAGVGACVFGRRTCRDQGGSLLWSLCEGSGVPHQELCGDTADSDCDGEPNNGCLACDGVSPLWSNAFKDDSLRLKNLETAGFDAGPHKHSWICSQDSGRVNLCGDTVIQLTGGQPTIVGGKGIGPTSNTSPRVTLSAMASGDVWMLVDCTYGPVTFEFAAPKTKIILTTIGSGELRVHGVAGALKIVAKVDINIDGPLSTTGDVVLLYGNNLKVNGAVTGTGGFTAQREQVSSAPLAQPGGCP